MLDANGEDKPGRQRTYEEDRIVLEGVDYRKKNAETIYNEITSRTRCCPCQFANVTS